MSGPQSNSVSDTSVLSVFLLDVGQGDATLILPPGDAPAIVFDCRDFHVVDRLLSSFEVKRIGAVLFSHLDRDHIAGGAELLKTWRDRIDEVFIDEDGHPLDDSTDDAKTAKALVDYVVAPDGQRPPWRVRAPARDLSIASGADWSVTLLAPAHRLDMVAKRAGRRQSPNERSAVLRVERQTPMGLRAVLVGADAPLVTWAELTSAELTASIFRTPHHGGAIDDGPTPDGWTPSRLYDAVAASDAVISVGTTNAHDHPRQLWVEPLAVREGCRVRCTQVTAKCQPGIAEDALVHRRRVLGRLRPAEPAWRHLTSTGKISTDKAFREVPCAGTVAVALRSDGSLGVHPSVDDHADVVGSWQQPWCRDGFDRPTEAAQSPDPLDLLLAVREGEVSS